MDAAGRLAAVVHTLPGAGEDVVDAHQGEHGERPHQGAGLDGDAAPQQGGVARLVEQGADGHLQVGEEPREDDPGGDLQGGGATDRDTHTHTHVSPHDGQNTGTSQRHWIQG